MLANSTFTNLNKKSISIGEEAGLLTTLTARESFLPLFMSLVVVSLVAAKNQRVQEMDQTKGEGQEFDKLKFLVDADIIRLSILCCFFKHEIISYKIV